ncbi:hypothetical protein QYE76_029541 [Lolium multiflorum]|uniref:CCHC-type domain-containing protein n=1 Tax=Lolium multiflorum TaxID=4521 RepID=A0AAD8VIC5_LOLMU|nr:hypothetical protein QYE76_029541 [Lolium multiflorum]
MGKPRDTKIAILPSTTRKGTTLSTSAALDSPSVIDKLVSPPHASHAGTSAESENSHNIDNVSAVLDDSGSLGSFLDATIARSRQIENTETPNATTPVKSPELDYSSDDLDEDYVELDDDFIEKCNATTDARKIKKLLAEHAVRYKPSPDPKFATSPINIRDKDYDFSLDLSHIAIVEKTPFCGTEKESAVEHLTELSTLSGVFSDDVKMRTYFVAKIFPFSLKDDAKTWYNNLPPGSIKSPTDLRDVFFRKYFPASAQHAALQRIYNFDQEDGEKLPEAWARFCSLIRAQPDHDLEKHDLLDIFYSGLTIESRAYLDSCAGCVFRKRTPDDAEELLAKIGRNHDDWSTPEPTPTPIVKKRGMIKLNDEDMREAKKSLKEKGIKPEDVKNLPPIEDICETIPPSSMIEYMKDIVTNKRKIPNEEISTMLANYSFNGKIPKKLGDPVTQHCLILTDFVVLEMPEDDNMSIILGRPFLNTAGAVIDCNKGMVTFNVDDKEHTVYFPKRIDKKGKMKKFKFGELFKKATTSTGRPSRASTQIRRSYNEDVIAPSFAPEEDHGAPNASSFPCYEFLTNAGILDDFFTLVNRAGLATYVGDERGQYYRLTKVFVESFKFHNTEYEPTVKMLMIMASPSINFNQFLEKEKLKSNGSNFTDWFRHVRIFLNGGNLQYVLEAPLGPPPPPAVSEDEKNVFENRVTRYSQVQCAILCSLEAELQKRFEHHDPCEMIRELKVIFETHAVVESYEASKQFFGCMMEEGSSVSEHVFAMSGHARKLSDLGIVIPNQLGIHRVLQSLPPSYKNFVMNYNMQNMNKELPELFSMLKSAEVEIQKEHQVLMVNKTTGFKKQGKPKKGNFKKGGKKAAAPPEKPKGGPKPDTDCYYCNGKGHWKRNCPKYLADLKSGLVKKKKETAAFTLNRAPSKSIETTPYELWFQKKPKLSFLKVWGCEAYVKKLQPDKLEPKAEKCIFIGYPKETIGYTFYHRSEGKIFVAKNRTFLEKEFLTKEVTGRKVELDEVTEPSLVDQSSAVPEDVPVPPAPIREEANDNDHETSNEVATEPRRSTRERTTPDWYDPCLNIMIVDNNDEDPATYEEAMMSPDSNKWQEAMKSEMGSMYDNKCGLW